MANILPAATVVLVRDSERGLEVLLLHRSKEVSFARESWVFPGGRIDEGDYARDLGDIQAAARRGAVREALEETGLTVAADDLVYFSHWTTPASSAKRYATWFFIADLGSAEQAVVVDGSEIVDHRWYRPAEAIAAHHAGAIAMMPPTLITLSELEESESTSAAAAIAHFRRRPVPEYLPRFCSTDSGVVLLYEGDVGYDLGDPDGEGPRHRCYLLDEAWRYEKRSG